MHLPSSHRRRAGTRRGGIAGRSVRDAPVPDKLAPLDGARMDVVGRGGLLTVMFTPGLKALPVELNASERKV